MKPVPSEGTIGATSKGSAHLPGQRIRRVQREPAFRSRWAMCRAAKDVKKVSLDFGTGKR